MTDCAQCGRTWPTHLNAEDCAEQDAIEQTSDLTIHASN